MRRGIRRVLGFVPLTPAGLLVGIGSLWAWWGYGLGRGDLVLRTLGSVGLAVLALAMISSALASIQLYLALSQRRTVEAPLELEVGHAGPTGFSAKVTWLLPLVDAHVRWLTPEVRHRAIWQRGKLTERVTPTRRGEFDSIVREVTVEDHLGLASIRFEATEHRRVRFTPSVGALKNIHVVQGMAAGDAMSHPEGPPSGDPMDIRHYGAGDPIKFVLWKVFAKSRTLVVRTAERAIAPEQRTVAYLVSGPQDQAAAGATRVAIESNTLGTKWALCADGATDSATNRRHAMELIVQSAQTPTERGGEGLGRFLSSLQGPSRRAVVFVPPVPGPWLERVLASCGPEHLGGAQLDFVVCTDGIASPAKRGAGWLLATEPAEDGPVSADPVALGTVLRRLAGAGRLMVLDRQSGEIHPESHLTHLMRNAS